MAILRCDVIIVIVYLLFWLLYIIWRFAVKQLRLISVSPYFNWFIFSECCSKLSETMITEAERTRLRNLFSDTISLLCRGGLPGKCASRVDALIGVTLDNQEVVMVNISENFWNGNDYETRQEINAEMSSDMQCGETPQKSDTSGSYSYSVKDECEAGASQDRCNGSAPFTDRNNGPDIPVSYYHSNSYDAVERTEPHDVKPSNQILGIDSLMPEYEQTSVSESDSDCLFIKTELPEDDAAVNSVPAESEDFIVSSANSVAMPLVPADYKSSYGSSSVRMKCVQNTRRRSPSQWNPYGSKFYTPHERYNTMERGALYSSQVSCTATK